jgi:predicted NBD/HSP70 family sugar kinase
MILAFDIGGTYIKYGLINEKEHIIEKKQIPTLASQGGISIMSRIIEIIKKMQEHHSITGIAISSAGVIDPYLGIVLSTTDTMPGYTGTHIKEIIESKTNFFTTVENDVNCAALAEAKYSKPPLTDFIAMTIGTGIGGAIVSNKEIFHGSSYSAGEWGRLMIDGKQYEKQASITSLIEYAKENGLDVKEGLDVFNLYDQNHPVAKIVVEHFYNRLAVGIVNLIYSFNPKVIVIGGGISHRGDQFIDELNLALEKQLDPYFMKSLSIRLATKKNDSGMLGAYIHHQNLAKKR